MMDGTDRALINRLQDGLPIEDRPYAGIAAELGLDEDDVIARLERLLADGTLTRFGPMYHAEQLGGGLCLCAIAVPEEDFDRVTEIVNAHPEVAHNYAREHALNMWFVLATETPDRVEQVARRIETDTGLAVHRMPKLDEYYVGLKLEA